MQYRRAAILSALSILIPSVLPGQGAAGVAPQPFITNYQFVSQIRISSTQSDLTYRADIVNPGLALSTVTASVTSLNTSRAQVVQGQNTLHFSSIPAYGQVTSDNTFTVLVEDSAPLDFSLLQWTIAGPIANAGPNQTVKLGSTVRLDGSASANPLGIGTLSYSWSFVSLAPWSSATLTNSTSVTPSFVVDMPGTYVVALTVSNGSASSTANVAISTVNTPPVANAGPNQSFAQGAPVVLDGRGSNDVDGNPISYTWTLISLPAGSAATLSGNNMVSPTFVADQSGTYIVQLIVSDGAASSNPASVTITTHDPPPVANAGAGQMVSVGDLVQLNGYTSTDVDGSLLSYQWSLISAPPASTATLSDPNAVNPTFTADLAGTYVAQLIVSNGAFTSLPASVIITTNGVLPPTAQAGPDQYVTPNGSVTLNGGGTDPQGLPLTFHWALISDPAGSTAALQNANSANAAFVADLPGAYVAQLIVNNGSLNSAPSTVTIATANAAPLADAGPNQNVTAGSTVILDGSHSSDPASNPLTYSWALLARPNGSAATLSAATSVSPAFIADVPGTYVAQVIVNNGSVNGNPKTVMIAAATTPAIAFSPNSVALATNAAGTLSVMLSAPAMAGGQVINLASNNSSIAAVPATVTVPPGSTGANVAVTTGNAGAATITASAAGFQTGSATVNVAIPALLTLDSASVGMNLVIHGSISLGAPAPSGGVVVTLSAAPANIVFVNPSSVTINAGQTSAAFSVTGVNLGAATIQASAPTYANSSAAVSVVNLGKIILQSGITASLGQPVPFPVTLPTPAPAGGTTVLLASGDVTKVTVSPTSVNIPAGQTTPAVQPHVTGVDFGSANIGVSANGYTQASQVISVTATASLSPQSVTIKGSAVQNLTLTLSGAAPGEGLTINLSSDDTTVATVPSTVTVLGNTTSVIVPVTGTGTGSTVIHASSAPNIADTTAKVTVTNAGTLSVLAGATLALGQTQPFSVVLPAPAPTLVAVTLVSSDPTKVQITPGIVFISAGSEIPATLPQITGVGFGTVAVIASAPGYSSSSQAVSVILGASFTPPGVVITGPTTANLTLTLSMPAPAAGFTVNLSSSDTTVATVPATIFFAPQATSATITVTGVGAGTAVIHASAPPSLPDMTAIVTVLNPDGTPASPGSGDTGGASGGITVGNVSVGQNLQTLVGISLPESAPADGLNLTVTSSDPTKLVVASRPTDTGTGSLSIVVPKNIQQFGIYVQGLASSGTVTLTVSADGMTSGTGTITLSPSGFVLIGPTGTIASSLTTNLGYSTTFLVYPAQLDSSFNFLQFQQVRGSLSPSVGVTSSDTNVGTISTSPLVFNAGDQYNGQFNATQFSAVSPGSTTIAVNVPAGFSTPAQGANSISITVSQAGVVSPDVTVGKNLEVGIYVGLKGVTPSAEQMTVTSNDPSKLLLSTTANGVGAASITLTIQKGLTGSPGFYVQALASSGTATYTATLAGFGSANGTVTFAPSGFIISSVRNGAFSSFGPSGGLTGFETGTKLGPATLVVVPTMLDSSGNIVSSAAVNTSNNVLTGQLLAGQPVTMTITSSNTSVGSLSGPVTITPGSLPDQSTTIDTTMFNPLSIGTTNLTINTPAGFSAAPLTTRVQILL